MNPNTEIEIIDVCSYCDSRHSIADMTLCTVCKQFTCMSAECDGNCQCRMDEDVERLLTA